jgi:hypothetical protein
VVPEIKVPALTYNNHRRGLPGMTDPMTDGNKGRAFSQVRVVQTAPKYVSQKITYKIECGMQP